MGEPDSVGHTTSSTQQRDATFVPRDAEDSARGRGYTVGMAILSVHNLSIQFGGVPVIAEARLDIEAHDRIGLLGRNGEGKSTLLRILAGHTEPETGAIRRDRSLGRVAYLPQTVPESLEETVGAAVRARVSAPEHETNRLLTQLGLSIELPTATLSAGMRRRVLLAAALAADPQLLLLDEPTNHLDIPAIEWLESTLCARRGALVVVTHDRAFLERIATRIVHLDRGRLTRWSCAYRVFIERYQAFLQEEAHTNALFDKRLAREEAWIRRGILARRTRNEGRVRALEAMRRQRLERRGLVGEMSGGLQGAERSGRIVLKARALSHRYGDHQLIANLDLSVERGDRLAIVGPNGCGKTTLLQLLLGELAPQEGSVVHGTRLEIAYFDQELAQLEGNATVQESLLGGHDTIIVDGKPRHITSYLKDFLFTRDAASRPVRTLSGGERKRLLLARLFAMPANLLVMDEPTNDLDIETLELLEDLLQSYSGTLLLVSHDRAFINNVATSTLVFQGQGRISEHVGGYRPWEPEEPKQKGKRKEAGTRARTRLQRSAPQKLGFREERELERLPEEIEDLENEQSRLHERMSDPEFFRGPAAAITAASARLRELETTLAASYARWEELEART